MHHIFAHRGVSGLAIENSAKAIELCAEYKINALEIDLQLLGDNTPVLFHDANLQRLANRDEALIDLTKQTMQKVQLNMPGKQSQPVLFMDEFMQIIIKHKLKVNVELKRFDQSIEHYIQYIMKPLLQQVPNAQILISGFDCELLKAVRAYSNDIDIALLSRKLETNTLANIAEIKAVACHLQDDYLQISDINKIKKQVKYLGVYTVNDTKRYKQLREAGVDYVFSDYPHLL